MSNRYDVISAERKFCNMSCPSSLKYAGSIKLSNNNNLRNINGLTSLTELGSGDGSALVRGIAYALEVSSNDMLTNLDGLLFPDLQGHLCSRVLRYYL